MPHALLEWADAHLAQAQAHAITIAVDARLELPDLAVEPERMAQVLGNLLNNAVRYTRRGGRIGLAAEGGRDAVRMRVQDTGTGISPDALPHIFERFYPVDPSRQQDGSSGLGLAIAKGIVEAHGGRIEVESTRGRGTTFTITFPLGGAAGDQSRTRQQRAGASDA